MATATDLANATSMEQEQRTTPNQTTTEGLALPGRRRPAHARHATQEFSHDDDDDDDEETTGAERVGCKHEPSLSLNRAHDPLPRPSPYHLNDEGPGHFAPDQFLQQQFQAPRQQRRGQQKAGGFHRRRASYQSMAGEVSTRILLPGPRIGVVIGRGGDVIRGICEATGAHVSISSPGANGRDVDYRMTTVTGSLMAVCWAVELVAQKTGAFAGHSFIHPDFNSRKRSLIASATSMPPRSSSSPPLLAPTGETDSLDGDLAASTSTSFTDLGSDEKAASRAASIPAQELNPSPPGIKLVIDSSTAGSLIGKGGITITEIRMQSKARVLVLDEEESEQEGAIEGERVVIVIGMPDACRRAHQLINTALSCSLSPALAGTADSHPMLQHHLAIFNHQGHHHHHQQQLPSSGLYPSAGYGAPHHPAVPYGTNEQQLAMSMAHMTINDNYYGLPPYRPYQQSSHGHHHQQQPFFPPRVHGAQEHSTLSEEQLNSPSIVIPGTEEGSTLADDKNSITMMDNSGSSLDNGFATAGEPSCEVIVRIPNEMIGRLIGKEGASINRIRQESGCQITISSTRPSEAQSTSRTIRIQGSMQATHQAHQLISDQMLRQE